MTETRREDAEPADGPSTVDDTVGSTEPAVDGVAVELPGEVPPAPAPAQPLPVTIHQPPVEAAPAPAMNPIVDVSAAPSTAPSFDGHAAEPPMNPIGDVAAERPELIVGAAFAGGILAAMILRRLGN
ncbi:MAG: hypothetical protein WKF48_08615 [Solirubrobacteraceae bacterium]